MCPGSFHVKCGAGLLVPRLLAAAAVFGNCSRMATLTRCARIMHRRALATTRPKDAAHLWRVFRNIQGGTHGGTVTYTTGGRGFSSCCRGERMESGLRGQFSVLEPLALSRKSSIWGEPMSGINTSSPLDCTGDTSHRLNQSYGFVPGPVPALVTCFLHLVLGRALVPAVDIPFDSPCST